ncbi:MFS transporter [Nitrospirillum viridazoti CBAmc]|uniref:MFS transporter n=2 Tax=Nitrospirillum TaxID=1543705 RepID=A0A248JUJ4_9PROT|nr:MFS transporter [Nitrospirillum amazonense CBAmc]
MGGVTNMADLPLRDSAAIEVSEMEGREDMALVRPKPLQAFAALYGGAIALLITGLQPLVLGQLEQEGRLTASEIGLTAMAELLMVGIGAAVAGWIFKPRYLRMIGGAAGMVHALASVAAMAASGLEIVISRAIAGLAAGILLWIAMGMIARTSQPERWSGSFLTGETLFQLIVVTTLSTLVVPRFGANGALAGMAVLSAMAALFSSLNLDNYPLLVPQHAIPGSRLPMEPLIALLGVFVFLAAMSATWVYLDQLGAQLNLPATVVGTAMSVFLAFQVAGGASATWLGSRPPLLPVLGGASLLGILGFFILAYAPSPGAFLAGAAIFGFVWLFALPYQLLLLVKVDDSRRAALQLPAAQLLGSAGGPLLASFLVGDVDARPAVFLGMAGLGVTFFLFAWSQRRAA